jgi:hypothetical protein
MARIKQTSRKRKKDNGKKRKVWYTTIGPDGEERCTPAPPEREKKFWELKPLDMPWATWNLQFPPIKPAKLGFKKWAQLSEKTKGMRHAPGNRIA